MTTPTHDCYGFPFTAPMIGHFALTPAEAVLVQQLFDAGRLVVDIPSGRGLVAGDVQALQGVTHDAIGALIGFSEGRVAADETMAALLHAMGALAWHRENVGKASQPELELEMPQ